MVLPNPIPEAQPGDFVLVRDAVPEDLDFLLELTRETFLSFGSYDEYVEDWFQNEAVQTLVADVERPGGRARAGFAMLTFYPDPDAPKDEVADLLAIAVTPELRSVGVGSALLERAFERVRAAPEPVREMWLVVADTNARAQRMFAGHGFRMGPGVGVYPAGQQARRMIKPFEAERTGA